MRHKMGIIQRWLMIITNSVKRSSIASNILISVTGDMTWGIHSVLLRIQVFWDTRLYCCVSAMFQSNIVYSSYRLKAVHEQCTVLGPPSKCRETLTQKYVTCQKTWIQTLQSVSTFLRIKLKCHKEHRVNPI